MLSLQQPLSGGVWVWSPSEDESCFATERPNEKKTAQGRESCMVTWSGFVQDTTISKIGIQLDD
jgi:hypothetical protein